VYLVIGFVLLAAGSFVAQLASFKLIPEAERRKGGSLSFGDESRAQRSANEHSGGKCIDESHSGFPNQPTR